MFGWKSKSFRRQALKIMADWVPIEDRDLEAFGSLLKFHFDQLYNKGASPIDAAFSVGGLYFLEVVRCARDGDIEYFKHMQRYSAWLGACADHVLSLGYYLTVENEQLVRSALSEANRIYLPMNKNETLGEMIEEEKSRAALVKSTVEAAVAKFKQEFGD